MTRYSFSFSLAFAIGIFFANTSFAQLQTFQFEQLDSLNTVKKKTVVVFIHTDWCRYCHQMKNTTFKNDRVIELLNDHFYFIDLNAESTQDINYHGHTFKYRPTGGNTGVHELAEQLGTIDGKLNYPSISILNEKNKIVFQYGGLIKTNELLTVLKELLKQQKNP